jgi:outer membrane protein assembly factor BamB
VDRRNGKYRWSYVTRSPIYSNIVATSIGNEDHFFFGADNGTFYCLNSLGKKVWTFQTNGKIRGEALVHGSRIYFGSEDNHLYCLNVRTGREVFKFATDGNINSRPLLVKDIIFFGSTDSFIHGVYT